ncbi:MAG: DUF1697 domain-containing protein [Micromonosporaceae bacterium]
MHVALLRGINLGAHARVGMADLRQLFADLGHTDVTTYLQSGNVVFASSRRAPAPLEAEISERIHDQLGLAVGVLVRTADEMADVVAGNPFLESESDLAKLHVTYLGGAPDPEAVESFAAPPGEPARFAIAGREIYLHCPEGYGRTKLNNAFIERKLGKTATTRNWRTTAKLHQLATA